MAGERKRGRTPGWGERKRGEKEKIKINFKINFKSKIKKKSRFLVVLWFVWFFSPATNTILRRQGKGRQLILTSSPSLRARKINTKEK